MMLRTAHQKRSLGDNCPVARVADLMGDSCSLLIVRDLLEGPRSYTDLAHSLEGISSRTLTKKLTALEAERLVSRAEVHSGPMRVEYSLTEKGRAFQEVVDAMRAYGTRYL